ncbi:HU family DNA-binding protein [Spirochaeta isovalerica]|uniref:Nucleoid DNA-binding protein n=1 Tax=Spirochaeta isovalerica TaxID=150 RepID=A0A841RFX9_9SPIO|nr:HU family DNA-binding protein [Spirochaeta isovalerica]MBB6481689.1 nucleoid DNA-binding protein [Spirochaeta isovalerica]
MSTPIPADVEQHLKSLVTENITLDMMKELWIRKDKLFSDQIALLAMDEVDQLDMDEERGILLLTYSGSLISLGCGEKRTMEYASIKLRSDVPHIIKSEDVSLTSPLIRGSVATFQGGQVQNTSSIYKIVVCREGVSVEEQEKRIREATVFITSSFVHLNRDLTLTEGQSSVDMFNKKEMVRYVAGKNGLSMKQTREIIDDYLVMAETGLLLGKAVSLGNLGKLSLKWKPERKARLGRNPATGEEITIPAKEAHYTPSFRFSSAIKERCEQVEYKET